MIDLKKKLKTKGWILGSWISSGSPSAAEMLASLDFDFLTIDVEHSPVNLPQAQSLFQAISAGNPGCAPLVRLSGVDYAETKRFLDAGAMGVIAPFVNTAAQAEQVVKAVKYPPIGGRGLGFSRANMYGLEIEGATSIANEHIFVCVQIEHVSGVDNIEKILAVPGIDAALIGPYDLSASMGHPGEFDHPPLLDAMDNVLRVCQKEDKVAGIHVVQPDVQEVITRFNQGYRMIGFSLDLTMMASVVIKARTEIDRNLTLNE